MKQKRRLSLFLFLTIVGAWALSSCYLVQNSKPSVLILAVDNLGVNQLTCATEPQIQVRSGISALCEEAIRYTHAYTTSPLSGPALTSVLTGQYPLQHGLRNNGKSFLSGRVTTVAEIALQQGLATSFFSGGAPILRKLNLQQGFEVFDDSWNPTPTALFRPFSKLQTSFQAWLKDLGKQSFFAVFYIPDLSYIQTSTQTDMGETRNLSFESQLEEFDESLMSLVQMLKNEKRWDTTLVILVGLNGPTTQQRSDELLNTNLFSERTHVGLLIKPPKKPKGQESSWSFDANVTLADLGSTLTQIFSPELKTEFLKSFQVANLEKTWQSSSYEIPERPILIESSWSEMQNTRYAIRWEQHLILLNQEPQIFNSFIDKLEISPIKISEPSVRPMWEKTYRIAADHNLVLWSDIPKEQFLKWKGLVDLWSLRNGVTPAESSFERLAHRLKSDPEIVEIYSRELLKQQDWKEMKRWAQGMKLKDLEKVASKNLKQDLKNTFSDPCLKILEINKPTANDLKQCLNPAALSLIEWHLSEKKEDSEASEVARKKFFRQYSLLDLDQKIVETNWALEGMWDIPMSLRTRTPVVEMMLALPEMQKYRLAAQKSLQTNKSE